MKYTMDGVQPELPELEYYTAQSIFTVIAFTII